MKKLLCTVFLVFLLFANVCFSQEIPTMSKYVNDFANVLSDLEETKINNLCAEIERNWTVEVAILTVKTTQLMSIEEYAVKVFEKNGIGKKDKDNGLLIVAAIEDRKWRFEVGYGLEPIINDAKAGLIGRTYLTPYFQEEEYGDGLYYAVEAVGKVIQNAGDTSFISEQEGIPSFDDIKTWVSILILIFIPMIFIAIAFSSFFAPKCPNCGTRMRCHYTHIGFETYHVCECPKCGKTTKKKKRRHFFFFVGGGGGFHGGGGGGGFGGGGSGGGGASGGW